MSTAVAGRRDVRPETCCRAREGGNGRVEETGLGEPPDQVPVADPARRPGCPATREHDLATRLVQLLRHLAAGLAAPHHEHAARRQGSGVPVVLDVDLEETGGQAGCPGRPMRSLERTVGEDKARAMHRPRRGGEPEATARIRLDRPHRHPLANGGTEALRIALQKGHDVIAGHEAVGVIAVVGGAWELDGPVRRHQAEAVPPAPPCLTDSATLEDHMFDPRTRQLVTQAQPSLPAAHDRHLDALHNATKGNSGSRRPRDRSLRDRAGPAGVAPRANRPHQPARQQFAGEAVHGPALDEVLAQAKRSIARGRTQLRREPGCRGQVGLNSSLPVAVGRTADGDRAREYLESRPDLWARTSDAGRHAIAEAVFERIDVLGVTDYTFTLTAQARARGWDAAFGPGVLRLQEQGGRGKTPSPGPGLRRGGSEHERRSIWSGERDSPATNDHPITMRLAEPPEPVDWLQSA